MIRVALWGTAGIVLGLVVHLVVVLAMPMLAEDRLWNRIAARAEPGEVAVLAQPERGEPNPLQLDPELVYAVCRYDLSRGPGVFSGTLPVDFWSIGVFDREGRSVYSTTNRSGVGTALELGVFNPAQTRLLAERQFEIKQGLLIVESPVDEIFAVLRLAVPHPAMRPRYEETLKNLSCGHIAQPPEGS